MEDFKQAEVIVEVKHYVNCPLCNDYKFSFGHLIKEVEKTKKKYSVGPWSCDSCGHKFNFIVEKDLTISVRQNDEPPNVHGYSLLKSTNGGEPIYFVIEDTWYRQNKTESLGEAISHKHYYYDEHTCPTNWIRGIEVIMFKQDQDPHGVFEFVDFVTKEDLVKRIHEHEDSFELLENLNNDRLSDIDLTFIFPILLKERLIVDSHGVVHNDQLQIRSQ
jgi:hypothetical protein